MLAHDHKDSGWCSNKVLCVSHYPTCHSLPLAQAPKGRLSLIGLFPYTYPNTEKQECSPSEDQLGLQSETPF